MGSQQEISMQEKLQQSVKKERIEKQPRKAETGQDLTCGGTYRSPYNLLGMTCVYTE